MKRPWVVLGVCINQVCYSRFSMSSLPLSRPPRGRAPACDGPPFLGRHRLEPALAADLPAARAERAHDVRNLAFGGFVLNPLWHTPSWHTRDGRSKACNTAPHAEVGIRTTGNGGRCARLT